jgi:hypothetical protein
MSDDLPPDADRTRTRTDDEARLIRSAALDRGGAAAKRRALEAGLSVLEHGPATGRGVRIAVASAVLAAAAALVLLVQKPEDRVVTPERVPPKVADRALTAPPVAPLAPSCPELVIARGVAPLIEDFEAADSRILPLDGRSGSWMTYDDGTGKQTPPGSSALFPSRIPGGRGASKSALHVMGGKFTLWGVTLGAELADAGCYDASAYAGIELHAKGPGKLRVGLQMIDVQDVKYGGLCSKDCYNTHRAVITLGKTFDRHVVRWEDLHQLFEGGPPVSFDPKRVRFIEFGVAPEDTPFDIWIDDVAFVRTVTPDAVQPAR